MKHVIFLPWVGAHYQDSFQKLKTLILGESQYTTGVVDSSLFTIKRVEEQIDGSYTAAFWTKIGKAFLGRDLVLEDKREFWNSVSFYNYVQEFAGDRPRIMPADASWKRSETAFVEVLEELRPDFILALGERLWENMPFLNAYKGPKMEGAWSPETWIYPHSTGCALAYCVRHPSSGRFSSFREHPCISIAMDRARELKVAERPTYDCRRTI